MSFDRKTGELFVGDVGWELWESVHRVEKGGNYGWSAMEGPQPIKSGQVGPTPIRPPLIELPHTIACSVTGGRVYRGRRFPELQGAYVFGDWETRRLWAARFEGDRTREMSEIARPSVRFVAFGEDRDGELLFVDEDGGTLHTLEKGDDGARNADFPATLSKTGLFASVEGHRPANGVIPFAVNGRQWLDGATAEHWAAFPGTSSATLYANGRPIPGLVSWHMFRMHFPKDAVLMRTLSLSGRRLETQLLHYDGVDWRGYTFAWRDDQSDADLVPAEGAEKELRDGGRSRVWQFQSRSQCMSCHSNQSEYAPGVPSRAVQPPRARRPEPTRGAHGGGIRPTGRRRRQSAPAVRRCLGRSRAEDRRPDRRAAAPGGAGPSLPARQLRPLPFRPRRRLCPAAAAAPHPGLRDERGRHPPHPRRFLAAGREDHQAGRPVREHPVLPHGQVRPRSDAAHRLRAARRGGPGLDRTVDRRDRGGRAQGGPRTNRAAQHVADRSEVRATAGAQARTRRAECHRA